MSKKHIISRPENVSNIDVDWLNEVPEDNWRTRAKKLRAQYDEIIRERRELHRFFKSRRLGKRRKQSLDSPS